MIAFADSSALVKLYADEAGSSEVRGFERFVVAQIARVEVPAALWKKQRIGDVTTVDAGLLVADFEADWFGTDDEAPRFDPVRMTALVVEDAARLTGTHGLRAYHAVQLATARAVRGADRSITLLAAFDHTLRDAAVAEGFDVVP